MDTALADGDFVCNTLGMPLVLEGKEELLQQVRIRLQARRGGFPYDPSLGSRLFRLEKQGDPAQRQREALEYVQEALSPMHQIDLQHVALTETGVQVGVSTDFGESAVEIPLWEPEEGGDADGDAIV